MEEILKYFKGDELAAKAWQTKYAIEGEVTPDDMHKRMAKEFARIEWGYRQGKEIGYVPRQLSDYGQELTKKLYKATPLEIEEEIYQLFKDFKYIVPGGSVMSMLGNTSQIGSLSNCFVIGQPSDSYGGIMFKRTEQAQLMKRRGGVGKDLSLLRPKGAFVNNAAKTSTGPVSFMDVDSEITREVAQGGRRGALMETISIKHPDSGDFTVSKQDLDKITGANISVKISDDFMEAVEKEDDFIQRYPVTINPCDTELQNIMEYGILYNRDSPHGKSSYKKIHSKELWDSLVHCAWNTAEPGIMFDDRHHDYSPDGIYPQYRGVTTNPCFHPDTLIDTIEGKKRIADIIEPTYVHSMDKDGHICIKPCSAAFKTRENANTIKITLRNGSSIQITPEHKIHVQGIGFIEAKNLNIGDRINHILRARRGKKYVGIKLTSEGNRDYVMEHKLIYEGVFGNTNDDIHHLDENTFNNTINNLQALSHSEHSRLTALEQNPQSHQIKDSNTGKFIINDNKTITGIKQLPDDLSTNFKSRFDNCIISIEEGEKVDVYDIQVADTHCLIANNMVAHNCGEIYMQPYDSCRLIHINLTGFVINPYTESAQFDVDKLYEVAYKTMRLADDLIDLEIEAIDRILAHISRAEQPDILELELWTKIQDTAKKSRRAGVGFTGLADVFAMLGMQYGSEESLEMIHIIMDAKLEGELDATSDMARTRGSFDGCNMTTEFTFGEENSEGKRKVIKGNNAFYQFLLDTYPEQTYRMIESGRRNVSWSTVAPTGTVSMLTQTSSGIEPIFAPYYERSKKCMSEDERVDFIDTTGEKFTKFYVLHEPFREWMVSEFTRNGKVYNSLNPESLEEAYKNSPWFSSDSASIDWRQRIELQSIVQAYTTHSISSTINLPKDTTREVVSDILMTSWKRGLKGITIYRDGCRDGILNTISYEEKVGTIKEHSAPKRPKVLPADMHIVKSQGITYAVIIGLMGDKPLEIFAYELKKGSLGEKLSRNTKGTITKIKKGHYSFDSEFYSYPNLQLANDRIEERACTVYTSMLLRHGAAIPFIIDTTRKINDNITSFSSAMCRVLGKYTPKEEVKGEVCPECGSSMVHEAGCTKCSSCTYSKCLMVHQCR